MAQVPTRQNNGSGPMAESLLGVIAQAAANPDVDVDKMLALLNMQERILERDARMQFDQAMRKLNEHDLNVGKAGEVKDKNGGLIYKFAKWEDMDALIRPLMKPLGLWFSFDTEDLPGGRLKVIGTLHHEGGHSRSASIPLFQDTGQGRNANQAMGSTTSYGKRYIAEMLLNIVRADEDDDGAGGQKTPSRQTTQHSERPSTQKTEPKFLERAAIALSKEVGDRWLKLLQTIVEKAPTLDELAALRGEATVKKTMAHRETPEDVKDRIIAMFDSAGTRLAAEAKQRNAAGADGGNDGQDLTGQGANGTHTPGAALIDAKAVQEQVETVAKTLEADKSDPEPQTEWMPGDP